MTERMERKSIHRLAAMIFAYLARDRFEITFEASLRLMSVEYWFGEVGRTGRLKEKQTRVGQQSHARRRECGKCRNGRHCVPPTRSGSRRMMGRRRRMRRLPSESARKRLGRRLTHPILRKTVDKTSSRMNKNSGLADVRKAAPAKEAKSRYAGRGERCRCSERNEASLKQDIVDVEKKRRC